MNNLIYLFHDYGYLFYLIILVLAIIEGPIISVFLGAMLHFVGLNFYLVFLSIVLGDLIGDSTLYFLGYKYGDRI